MIDFLIRRVDTEGFVFTQVMTLCVLQRFLCCVLLGILMGKRTGPLYAFADAKYKPQGLDLSRQQRQLVLQITAGSL